MSNEIIIPMAEIDDEILFFIKKINKDIGFCWYKRYIYTAFWSNISTPINLSIIVLTALTTGQNATKSIISDNTSTILGVVVLFVSIFNTFFRPNEQLVHNKKIKESWTVMGQTFDEIYYNRMQHTLSEKLVRLNQLHALFKNMSELKRKDDNNYLIDFLYLIIRVFCMCNNVDWVNINKAIDEDKQRREERIEQELVKRQSIYIPKKNRYLENNKKGDSRIKVETKPPVEEFTPPVEETKPPVVEHIIESTL